MHLQYPLAQSQTRIGGPGPRCPGSTDPLGTRPGSNDRKNDMT